MGCKDCDKSVEERYKAISKATGKAFLRYRDENKQLIYLDTDTFNNLRATGIKIEQFETV